MKSRVLLVIVVALALSLGYVVGRFSETSTKSAPAPSHYVMFPKLGDSATIFFPIYGFDDVQQCITVDFYVPLSSTNTLQENLNSIAKRLSLLKFGGLPIVVGAVEEMDGKRIARVDLRNLKAIQDFTWERSFFQGSTGGGVTQHTLIETFLQRDYVGNWIDGVRFTYEGESPSRFDHVPNLGELMLRSQKPDY